MINELAASIIHDLRHDLHTREHFYIYAWEGRKTCGTVGCIAGTAILRVYPQEERDCLQWNLRGGDLVGTAVELLGLPTRAVGNCLFIPGDNWIDPILEKGKEADWLVALGDNERPDLETVAKMVAWVKTVDRFRESNFGPTACANALESVLKHERQYVDWAEAHEGVTV